MAATNFTPISLYHTDTPGAQPTNTNLVNGELALNIYDGKLYYKDNNGDVQLLASKTTSSNVTSVSLVSANGFSGTVADPSTTPAITLTTSVSGVLKGSGGALVAASPGVDYAVPPSGSSILYANGSGGFSSVTIGSNLTFAGGTLSASGGGSGGVLTFNTRSGNVVLASSDVTTALTYTPVQPNGTGATGTWGINISGNAATATSATTASSATTANTANSATTAGSATNATNATNSTYATYPASGGSFITTSNISSYAPTLSGSQIWSGTNTFSGNVNFLATTTSQAWNFTSSSSIYYYSGLVTIAISSGSVATWDAAGNYTITNQGYKPGGGSWAATSDARLKTNAQPLTGALNKVCALNPVTYGWKYTTTEPTVGFIAQEVQQVLPSAIDETKPTESQKPFITDDKVLNVGWKNDMTAYLVAAIKELKAEVDALKAAK